MSRKLIAVTLGLAISAALFVSSAAGAQTPVPQDCNATPPDIQSPSGGATDAEPEGAARDSLTDQLATCGSVLNPPPVGDGDVVQPAPAIDDPMAIHPSDPTGEMK